MNHHFMRWLLLFSLLWATTLHAHVPAQPRYIYDGLLVLQERDANNTPLVTYTRGLDLSGTLQGAGGIGGLLARTDGKGSVFYHADANGNVTALVDMLQTLEARYLYDSFGNLLGKWGPLADANHYRFSSKEWHDSGLYDYGRRFYQPNLQRWINADPLGEAGGINLHQFVGNGPVNAVDPFGFETYFSEQATVLGIELPYLGVPYRLPVNTYSVVDQGEALLALPAGFLLNASLPLGDFLERSGINDWIMAMPPNAASAIEAGFMAALRETRALARLARETAKAAEEAAALAKCVAKGSSELTTVSRWGSEGLKAGDCVMKGPVSPSTFARSFKWDPNPSNIRVPFKDWAKGQEFIVPKDSLVWPSGWEKFKGVFGQRIYEP